jgi:hypothetical protein
MELELHLDEMGVHQFLPRSMLASSTKQRRTKEDEQVVRNEVAGIGIKQGRRDENNV